MGGSVEKTTPTDWAIIFDLIASEYGYTWEQFIGLTYKLLDSCLEAIARRTHNKTAVLASIHGIKMDLYKRVQPVSEKVLADAKTQAYDLLKQKQQKIAARKNGKR